MSYPVTFEEFRTAFFVLLVNDILYRHAELNKFRAQGYTIRQQRNGDISIEVPFDALLQELQTANRNFPVLTFYDARTVNLFDIPDRCDLQAPIMSLLTFACTDVEFACTKRTDRFCCLISLLVLYYWQQR